MVLSPMSNYRKKMFLVLTSGKFLEALESGIGTGLVFLPFIFIFEQCDQNEQPVKCLESRFSIAPKKLTSLGLRIDNALKHPELYYSIYLPLDASFWTTVSKKSWNIDRLSTVFSRNSLALVSSTKVFSLSWISLVIWFLKSRSSRSVLMPRSTYNSTYDAH